jgi:hypothetical protein
MLKTDPIGLSGVPPVGSLLPDVGSDPGPLCSRQMAMLTLGWLASLFAGVTWLTTKHKG